jgi:hypothetical protein
VNSLSGAINWTTTLYFGSITAPPLATSNGFAFLGSYFIYIFSLVLIIFPIGEGGGTTSTIVHMMDMSTGQDTWAVQLAGSIDSTPAIFGSSSSVSNTPIGWLYVFHVDFQTKHSRCTGLSLVPMDTSMH